MPPPLATDTRIGQFYVQVNGSDLPPDVIAMLDDAVVEQDLAQPAMFQLRFNDPQLRLIDGDTLRLGAEVTLSAATPTGQRDELISGEITAVEPLLEQQNIVLVVRGYDRSHRLHRGSTTRTFLKQSDGDIVQQIAREHGLRADIEATGAAHEYVMQHNQSDMAFLRERAARLGYQAVVRGKTLVFRRSDNTPPQAPALEWGQTLLSFRARFTAVAQVDEVHVRGWDPTAKRAIVGKATRAARASRPGDGKTGGQVAQDAFGGSATLTVTDRPVRTQDEATRLAQAILDERAGDYVAAEGMSLGDARLRAGTEVTIGNLGRRLSGTYFITAARHEYTPTAGYTTHFYVSGQRPVSLLASTAAAPAALAASIAIGIVTNVNDPDKLGRVKLTFPWLDEQSESDWARIATPGAGAQRGFSASPEVNDEVLVAFEHGQFDRPFVIGGLWNGKDKPPAEAVKGGQVQTRMLRTRAGHHISLHDDDSAGKIELKTGKHTVVLDDSSQGKVEVKSGKHTVTLDDSGQGRIEITSGSQKIVLDNSGPGKISIEAGAMLEIKGAGGKLSITPAGVELSATGILTLRGTIVNIN